MFFFLAIPAIVHIDSLWNVTQGTNIILTCIVKGYPLPEVHWSKKNQNYHNGNESTSFSDDITVTAKLALQQVSVNDSGTYICHGDNSYGTISAELVVVVRGINVKLFVPF